MAGATTTTALISMPEIAELAEVKRPVVSTWRRRHPDFPAPIETHGRHPMFDARAVVDWLISTNRAKREEVEPDLRLYALTCLGAKLPACDLLAWSTALICLRHLDDEPLPATTANNRDNVFQDLRHRAAAVDPDDALLRTEIEALPATAGWLPGVVDELIEAAWGTREAYDRLLSIRHRFGIPALCSDAITPETARLIARLSGARERADQYGAVAVADPSAGAGDLLSAVLTHLGEDAAVSVTGAEPDPFLARLTRRRLMVAGVDLANIDLRTGDTGFQGVADAVVVQLPYRPKEDRTTRPFADIAQIAESLVPGRTAVVLGPADLLVEAIAPGEPGANDRIDLLKSGVVEAVVRLPGGLMPFRPAYQMGLWVLRHDDSGFGAGRVLLADVADRPLTSAVVDDLVADIVTWRRCGFRPDSHARTFATQVAIAGLLGANTPLTAHRPVSVRTLARPANEIIARVADVESDLELSGTAHHPSLRSNLAVRPERSLHQEASLRDLRASRWLTQFQGNRIAEIDIATIDLDAVPDASGGHPIIGTTEVLGDKRIGGRTIDRLLLADRYPRAVLTEPGDVVVTLTPRFGVHLDRVGFAVVEFPARVLRINRTESQLTPRVLAALLTPGPGTVRAPGAVRASTKLDQLRVRLLPPAEVEHLDALLAAVDERQSALRNELDLLDELHRIAVDGLTDGTLTITPPTTAI